VAQNLEAFFFSWRVEVLGGTPSPLPRVKLSSLGSDTIRSWGDGSFDPEVSDLEEPYCALSGILGGTMSPLPGVWMSSLGSDTIRS